MLVKRLLKFARDYSQGTPPDLKDKIKLLSSSQPAPVVWLLGKTQSGKSSIIRELTQLSTIEIGEGFKACTQTSSLYSYPSIQAPLLRFLDTRGLLESTYDPAQDISFCEDQAHVLLVAIKAGDPSVNDLLAILRKIKARHQEWPIIVAQTCLHECYQANVPHALPYPFAGEGQTDRVIHDKLADHLAFQRQAFRELSPVFVPIDFTLPEDDYPPADYGKEALVEVLFSFLPQLRWTIFQSAHGSLISGAYWRKAQPHIAFYTLLSTSAAAAPIPLGDIPVLTAIQLKMLHSVAGIYGQRLSYQTLSEIVGLIGLGFLSRLGWRSLAKLIPGGNIAYSAYTAAYTYGLGNACCLYFKRVKDGERPTREELRSVFTESLSSGKEFLGSYRRQKSKL